QEAARAVGQELMVLRAGTEREIDSAFTTLVQRRTAALVVGTGPFFVTRMDRIVTLAARHAVPTMYFRREFADPGGLMSYGSSTAETYGQVGVYTGRILKGDKPADLPVVQPTKFE